MCPTQYRVNYKPWFLISSMLFHVVIIPFEKSFVFIFSHHAIWRRVLREALRARWGSIINLCVNNVIFPSRTCSDLSLDLDGHFTLSYNKHCSHVSLVWRTLHSWHFHISNFWFLIILMKFALAISCEIYVCATWASFVRFETFSHLVIEFS